MIWIRADGGREIGTGHIMRCLSIAEALRDMGEEVCFLTADDEAVPLLEARGQSYWVLGSSWRDLEGELGTLLPLLHKSGKGVFLVDSYYVTPEYLRQAGSLMPVCYIDDLGTSGLPVNWLVNYNIFARRSLYGQDIRKTEYLLGTEYAPLRREFQSAWRPVRDKAKRVLVTTGGSDRYDLAGQILRQALSEPEVCRLEYCVVSGAYNPHLPQLLELEKRYENVHVFSNVSRMAELMQSCDIAVTAGGSTMYELCAVGIPILCFSFVDNQERIVEGFRQHQAAGFAGNYLTQGEKMIPLLTEQIAQLQNSLELRRSLSSQERKLVDGQGAWRIADRLVRVFKR